MRNWASGVTVVTSQIKDIRHGMTVSSFTSVALEPPLVLVALAKNTRTAHIVQESGIFAVTILAQGQEEISDRFAGRLPDDADRFVGLETATLVTGAPLLVGGLAWFDCHVTQVIYGGTHLIFVGEVAAVQSFSGEPLVYHNRAYRKIC